MVPEPSSSSKSFQAGSHGQTALHLTRQRDRNEQMRLLLQHNAGPNIRSFILKAVGNNADNVRLPIKHGAKVDWEDWLGNTPLQFACLFGDTRVDGGTGSLAKRAVLTSMPRTVVAITRSIPTLVSISGLPACFWGMQSQGLVVIGWLGLCTFLQGLRKLGIHLCEVE